MTQKNIFLVYRMPKKRNFATQNFESIWQNKTQNKETKDSKT